MSVEEIIIVLFTVLFWRVKEVIHVKSEQGLVYKLNFAITAVIILLTVAAIKNSSKAFRIN